MLAIISNNGNASDIVKWVGILQATTWAAVAWKQVSEMTIKNCFAKCAIVKQVAKIDETDLDEELAGSFKELTETNEI